MINKNLVIWFVGGNSVGKTTQASNFHAYFTKLHSTGRRGKEFIKWQEEGKECSFTMMNRVSANLGKFGYNQCGGTDTLNSKFQIQRSFEEACKVREVVIVEGIMATGQWINFLKSDKTVVWMILLDMDEESNFKRLKRRRAEKLGCRPSEVELTPKTKENLSGKLRGFRSTFLRLKDQCNYSTYVNVSHLAEDEVRDSLLDGLTDIILAEF